MTGSWLITGGTGTFAHAFVPRLLDTDASRIVVFSRDELKQAHMRETFPDPRVRFFVGDVRDPERLRWALAGVDNVVHAAAMKRIEKCEQDPIEAKATNIDGTLNVALGCIRAGVQKAVFLSTDKAAQPCTAYGFSKAMAERLWTSANVYAAGRPTRLSATRYGNVLGSRGSVIELWKHQAAIAGEITVTDPAMSRFWMTKEQAVDLVLLAFREMRGGEVFVPKLKGSTIAELAKATVPGVPWKITGLRGDEKLHETLISEDEARRTYDYGDHYRIEPDRTWESGRSFTTAKRVPEGFTYRSDTTEHMDRGQLEELAA